ncbi:MAG: class I SAM-dependent methyltransferase [Candidatus Hadarchaeales archaeon]
MKVLRKNSKEFTGSSCEPPAPAPEVKIVYWRELRFSVLPDVYEPAEDTFFLAENLEVRAGEKVLELGTGCGMLAVIAAKAGGNVVATDINPVAIECARRNAAANGVDGKIDFRIGDLFKPVKGERFNQIIFNPPYLPTDPEEAKGGWLEKAWDGGVDGRRVIERFLQEFPEHLELGGRAVFVQSSLSDIPKTIQMLKLSGLKFNFLQKKLPFEELFLFRCAK